MKLPELPLKAGMKITTVEYHIVDQSSNVIATCHSKENFDFIMSRCNAYDGLVENAARAYEAIEYLTPNNFIGLIKLPNGKIYNHRALWESLYLHKAEQAKEANQ